MHEESYRSMLRREFPNERIPPIVGPSGKINKAAIRQWFSAVGCPLGDVEIVVTAIKSGHDSGDALRLGMLARYMLDLSMEPIERTTRAIFDVCEKRHAEKFPRGKCAEDRAARLEGRPSRWGTPEYHKGSQS